MKIFFLFGSGISIPAEIAKVQNITDSILCGRDYGDEIEHFEGRAGNYLKKINKDQYLSTEEKEHIQNITEFLSIINDEANRFLEKRGFNRKANYEDLYYLTMQFDHIFNPEAIQWKFKQMLEEADCLVISGYGFGDDTINNRIASWVLSNKNRKIILIHKDPESLYDKADKIVDKGLWSELLSVKRLLIIAKWIQDVSWSEIKSHLPSSK
ncbi:MAG TPA: hypothetical protein PLW78_06035 [bacterium]|nr:hypothetical protein [bacterium]HRQ69841.1 hypothetical protein [bacterium]